MRAFAEKGLLRWAFGAALILHVMALAVASRLPPGRAYDGSLADIRVFSDAAPTFTAVVEMVQFPPAPQSAIATELALREPPAPTARAIAVPRPAVSPPESTQAARTGQPTKAPRPTATSHRPAAGGRPAAPETSAQGGGGGAPADLGSQSPQGDLPGLPSGPSAPGTVPGDRAEPGSGPGQGTGADTVGANGGGPGPGQGGSRAAGGGSGSQGGSTPGRPGPTTTFVSRSADRSEPRLLHKVAPSYPASAVTDGVEGTVKMKVLVTETGAVAEVEIVSSSGDRRLDAAAKECVRQWRYRPAVQDGKPRRVHTLATVEFELE